jgi:hypothetical protein
VAADPCTALGGKAMAVTSWEGGSRNIDPDRAVLEVVFLPHLHLRTR